MSFKFNFGENQKETSNPNENLLSHSFTKACLKHDVSNDVNITADDVFKKYNIADEILYVFNESLAEKNVGSEEISESLHTSDLVSGKYEGGLKVWECTFDLLIYMQQRKNKFTGKRVLDLGCGAGLLGIYALKFCNSNFVCFQDYNSEVIEVFTKPTLNYNLENSDKALLLSGDWSNIEKYFREQDLKFDIILTSETIYNTANYEKLYNIFESCLSRDGSAHALVSAKTYYFGVGGSVMEFTEFLNNKNDMDVSSVWKNKDGLSREILKITKTNITS